MRRKRKNKRALSPRCKRMTRLARLQSAKSWLKRYDGTNVCKHFGVDWRCAATELRRLGIEINKEYLQRRAETERQSVLVRQKRKESQAVAEPNQGWPPYASAFEAYLAGDFAALHALEQDALDAP